MSTNAESLLQQLFDAEQVRADRERELFEGSDDAVLATLFSASVTKVLAEPATPSQALKLMRLADLLMGLEAQPVARPLVAMLDHAEDSVRLAAGEALVDVAFDQFKDIAKVVEEFLEKGHDGLSMEELPWVFVEVFDPDPMPLVAKFLQHPKPDVVASALGVLVEREDADHGAAIRALIGDKRDVTLEDLDDQKVSLGDLAKDALEALGLPIEAPKAGARPAGRPGGRPNAGPRRR